MDGRWEEDLRFVWGGEFFSFFVFLVVIHIHTYICILLEEEDEQTS